MKKTVKERQTLLDIALEAGGRLETAMAIAVANGMSVTERLEEGDELTVPEVKGGGDSRTVELYRVYGISPATEESAEDIEACRYGGIGFMGIETDFFVS